MPVWALVLLIVLLLLLGGTGLFVKGLTFLLYIAIALLVIYVIVWIVRSLTGSRL